MPRLKLFFSKKDEVYYFLADDHLPLCDVCKKEIANNLVYHSIWAGRGVVKRSGGNFRCEVKHYHINCFENIYTRGDADEFKICIVVDKIPEDALPVFERSPSLVNSKGLNTFEVKKIISNSDAEILDRTIVANDPNQSKMIDFNRNLLEFQKREEELGDSIFLLHDMIHDQQLQIESEAVKSGVDKNDSVEDLKDAAKKAVNKSNKKNTLKPIKREKVYSENLPFDNVSLDYLDVLKNSSVLLPEKETKKEISFKDNKK